MYLLLLIHDMYKESGAAEINVYIVCVCLSIRYYLFLPENCY